MTSPLEAVEVHTDSISAVVIPQLGGRLLELTDLGAGRQWLWRNHRTPLGRVAVGAAYDDVWQGGFEELFPNDAPGLMGSVEYPDHGELWSSPWEVTDIGGDHVSLRVVGPVTRVVVRKTYAVSGNELRISYEFENPGDDDLPHLFKLHPAFAVNEDCRLELPGGMVEKVDPGFGNILGTEESQPWPTASDLSQCRDRSSGSHEFVYVSDLPAGWCGISDLAAGSRVRIQYPLDVFPYCWIFMTYGGWRRHNVAVLEPCTNYPKDLAEAIRVGRCALLPARSVSEAAVKVTVGRIDD